MATTEHAPVYTGDIAEQHLDLSREYTAESQEINFSEEQHAIWRDLFAGVYRSHFLEHLCQEYKDGFALLQLDPERIPTVEVQQQVMDDYNAALQADLDAVEVWAASCNNYDRTPNGRIVTQWPHSMTEYRRRTGEPDADCYDARGAASTSSL